MINWKEIKTDGVTPARNKYLFVLWDLVQGRPEPNPQKQYEVDMDIDRGVNSESEDDLYVLI